MQLLVWAVIWLFGMVVIDSFKPEEYYKKQTFEATLIEKWEDWDESGVDYFGAFEITTPRGKVIDEREISARSFHNSPPGPGWKVEDSLAAIGAPAYTYAEANNESILLCWIFGWGFFGFLWAMINVFRY